MKGITKQQALALINRHGKTSPAQLMKILESAGGVQRGRGVMSVLGSAIGSKAGKKLTSSVGSAIVNAGAAHLAKNAENAIIKNVAGAFVGKKKNKKKNKKKKKKKSSSKKEKEKEVEKALAKTIIANAATSSGERKKKQKGYGQKGGAFPLAALAIPALLGLGSQLLK